MDQWPCMLESTDIYYLIIMKYQKNYNTQCHCKIPRLIHSSASVSTMLRTLSMRLIIFFCSQHTWVQKTNLEKREPIWLEKHVIVMQFKSINLFNCPASLQTQLSFATFHSIALPEMQLLISFNSSCNISDHPLQLVIVSTV